MFIRQAFDGYEQGDVEGLLSNRLEKAREHFEDALEIVENLCEPVKPPKDTAAYLRYFCVQDTANLDELKDNEPKRLTLYKAVSSLLRAYANIASEMLDSGYTQTEIDTRASRVEHFEHVRTEVKLASGDYIDLKMYEPAMRHLIDNYIRAEDSTKISAFDDMSLIQLIVERGEAFVESLPDGIKQNQTATAETIENNIRCVIIDEHPLNPKYFDRMSELLIELIRQRKKEAIDYAAYLKRIVEITKLLHDSGEVSHYPATMNSRGKRALFDNLDHDEQLAIKVNEVVLSNRQDEWRSNSFKQKMIRNAIKSVIGEGEQLEQIYRIVNSHPYEF